VGSGFGLSTVNARWSTITEHGKVEHVKNPPGVSMGKCIPSRQTRLIFDFSVSSRSRFDSSMDKLCRAAPVDLGTYLVVQNRRVCQYSFDDSISRQ
jgi:hypothetical protein